MMKSSSRSLSEEASLLHPLLVLCFESHPFIADHDKVGIFILLYLSLRKPVSWCGGLLRPPIITSLAATVHSVTLSSLPIPVKEVLDLEYIEKKLRPLKSLIAADNARIVDIFNLLRLAGIKHNANDYVNRSLVLWASGERPYRLLHYIPTPMEVLQQQSIGERVMTLFLTEKALSERHTALLTYMSGDILHARDALEFLLHDIKHMENFTEKDVYEEQVGFFNSIYGMNGSKVKSFFTKLVEANGKQLWAELEYVISDM